MHAKYGSVISLDAAMDYLREASGREAIPVAT